MANILQVTTPSVNTDNRSILDSQEMKNHPESQRIQNPVNPEKVVRADGQEEGKAGSSTGEGSYRVIDFESNYGAFVQRMAENRELTALLEQFLFMDRASFLFAGNESVGDLVQQMLTSMQMDTPEELLEFMKGQGDQQVKFSGALFNGLRNLLLHSPSDNLRETVSEFLKAYNDYTAGSHLLRQMRSITDDIGRLMFSQFRDEFQELVDSMNWEASNGDTEANAGILNGRLIPFLSNYISRTHDYGAVRNAIMLLVFNAVQYENGGEDRLMQLFEKMAGSREFQLLFKGDARAALGSALSGAERSAQAGAFADAFSSLILKGANGEAGLENIQQFYNIINGMLLNESVYLPLIHILIPFRYQGKDVMSELWTDPDAGSEEEDGGRRIKMFFKFNIQGLGKFDMILALQDRQVDAQFYVPPALMEQMAHIQQNISGILKNNGLGSGHLMVREKTGDIRVEDVFSSIREKERGINVRI